MGGRRKYRDWVVLSVAALRRQRSSLRQNLCMHDPRAGASLEVRLFRLAIKRVECGSGHVLDGFWTVRGDATELFTLSFKRASDNTRAVR